MTKMGAEVEGKDDYMEEEGILPPGSPVGWFSERPLWSLLQALTTKADNQGLATLPVPDHIDLHPGG